MTTMARPAFPPLDADAFDSRLDARAAARGIPTLTRPESEKGQVAGIDCGDGGVAAEAASSSTAVVMASAVTPRTSVTSKRPMNPSRPTANAGNATQAQPTPRARMKPLNVELPDYVWIELKAAPPVRWSASVTSS